MNAKVNEVLVNARRMIIDNRALIDTNDDLRTIECRVADTVSAFHIYLDYISCFHECGDISDEEEEYLTRSAYYEFYK